MVGRPSPWIITRGGLDHPNDVIKDAIRTAGLRDARTLGTACRLAFSR